MSGIIVKTSSRNWMTTLAKAYKSKMSLTLVDDAELGINPINQTLLEMGRKANLSVQDWIAVVIGLGVGSIGAYLVVMAILDPEPFSKIGFAVGAGAVMTMGGGFAAMRVITGHKPPKVAVAPGRGFVIEFE